MRRDDGRSQVGRTVSEGQQWSWRAVKRWAAAERKDEERRESESRMEGITSSGKDRMMGETPQG